MTPEYITQQSVIHCLTHTLGYSLTHPHTKPVNESLLSDSLAKRGYNPAQISRALNAIAHPSYSLLRYGLQGDSIHKDSVHFIDWENPQRNSFTVAQEVPDAANRFDLVISVNGIALAAIELKRADVPVEQAVNQLITYQQPDRAAKFFSTLQLLIAGNESQGIRYATTGTPAKFFLAWTEEQSATDDTSREVRALLGSNLLINGIISLCHPNRLLTLIHDFIIYDKGTKKTARHNQFFAVLAAQERVRQHEGGIIWNTQGSGKSLIMVWLAKWITEHQGRVVIITDRDELDKQIAGLFANVDVNITQAKNCAHLRELLASTTHPVICSLIHKYGHGQHIEDFSRELRAGKPASAGNITAFIDECHRSNSGVLHDAVRHLMPNATLIGFTGTPLLRRDKKTSADVFGTFIHTYKFDDGIKDGVILPLRYEARSVAQSLSDREAIDSEFARRTEGLTEKGRNILKRRWATLSKLYSSRERLERIAGDIIADFETWPELRDGTATAMLAAGSVYEACRYWEIFTAAGFTECAVITSYDPAGENARASSSDLLQESEEDCKRRVYSRMLNGKKPGEFEREAVKSFKADNPQIKLLIVVDKLLTGFDAPNATYLYIDKSMRDHELFQAVCRVNRPKEGKTHGVIIDYMDLFRSLQSAVNDYTSGAFEGYDRADIEGLITSRYDKAKCEMEESISALRVIFADIEPQRTDSDFTAYFCGTDPEMTATRRQRFYGLVSTATRSFGECCGRLVSHYGYSPQGVRELRGEIKRYNEVKDLVRLNAGEKLGRSYDADMRAILDTYVEAGASETIGVIDEIRGDVMTLREKLPGDDAAKAEIIENGIRREIICRSASNPKFYAELSLELERLIARKKAETLDYEYYMRELARIMNKAVNLDDQVPPEIDTPAKRAMYDYLDGDTMLALKVYESVRANISPNWRGNITKQRQIQEAIYSCLRDASFSEERACTMTQEIFSIVLNQSEYER